VNPLALLSRAPWVAYWQLMRRYHRFEVNGIENVLRIRGPAVLVGYHGKPGARDLIMLQIQLLREHGQLTHAVVHDAAFSLPGLRSLAAGMLMIDRDRDTIAAVVARGEKLVITPGGIGEAWGSFRDRHRVNWDGFGYLRLAARHRLPVIPVAGVGVDDAFVGLYNAHRLWKPLWERFKLPAGTGFWCGLGPLGLWPFTPPFPVRIVQHIGAPMDLDRMGVSGPGDDAALAAVHERVVATVQEMLNRGEDQARGRAHPPDEVGWTAGSAP